MTHEALALWILDAEKVLAEREEWFSKFKYEINWRGVARRELPAGNTSSEDQ